MADYFRDMNKVQKEFRREVYRNLHWKNESVYSVRKNGLVEGHVYSIIMDGNAKHPVTFAVGPKGNQRVRDEKRKNVHAYIQGRECYNEKEQRWEYIGPDCNYVNDPNTVTVTYNPYKNDKFIRTDTNEPVEKAKVVIFGCGKMGREVKAIL